MSIQVLYYKCNELYYYHPESNAMKATNGLQAKIYFQ